LIRRIETTDLPLLALSAVRDMREYLSEVERACIARARTLGASPADIARALGITRQAVYKKLNALAAASATAPTIVVPDLEGETTEPS
jgi:hypothetical protein